MSQQAQNILKRFGLDARTINKPPDAMLAQVFLVEDQFILRSRPYEADTPARFAAECELCGQVAELTGFRFPEYERCGRGGRFVVEGGNFWTLHKIIPGRPLGSWFELHRIDPSTTRKVLDTQRQLHAMTRGCFDEKTVDRSRLLELVAPSMVDAHAFLSAPARERLQLALDRVKRYCESYFTEIGCFVHGDFHHGNILAQEGRITGFIDLDWCRVGRFYEDFSFTLMMMMRDYKNWSPAFNRARYDSILDGYGFEGDPEVLNDHLILYALFDCTVFSTSRFENAEAFYLYQKQFFESMCCADST